MTLIEILALSLALAADAFSVGAAVGLNHRSGRQVFRLSFHFGLFQSLFALIGMGLGAAFLFFMESWDHWIVCAVLAFLGVKMIRGAFSSDERDESVDLTRGMRLVGLSTAVSIDAFAAGVGMAAARAPLATSILCIGLVSALATLIAMRMADAVRKRIGGYGEAVAGVVLIVLGCKVLLEHLGFLHGI